MVTRYVLVDQANVFGNAILKPFKGFGSCGGIFETASVTKTKSRETSGTTVRTVVFWIVRNPH